MDREITDQQAKEYAEFLIKKHAYDIEGLSIHEMAEEYFSNEKYLTTDDFNQVYHYINKSNVTIEFEN